MVETTLSGAAQHQILKNDYASEWMGLEVLKIDDGHATVRMTLRQEMLNGFGMAHGGMIFAFADSAFALACNPAVLPPSEADTITVAAGVDINFLKPAYQGQVITAVANRRANNGRSGLYDIQIFAIDATELAAASEPAAVGLAVVGVPKDASPNDPGSYGELIAEFRGRSRTISKK